MIKVLYDHQMFSLQKYGGISRYFANLHQYINQKNNSDITTSLGVLYTKNQYLQKEKFPLPSIIGDSLLSSGSKLYRWNKRYSRHLVKKNEFDIFHPTYYHPYFLPYLKKPFVLTVHDMIYELFPEFFITSDIYIAAKRKLIEQASHIIAISESTKNDIKNILKIPDEKISVVYHGFYENEMKEKTSFVPPFSDYLLYVGDRTTYKNFNRFIQGVSPVLKKNPAIKIICTGGGPLQSGELEIFYRNGIEDSVIQISATDAEMKILYKNARAFIFPSLYEGFGFPLLEAFKNDCPVACSNTSCFEEVGGNAVIYFDPYNPSEITRSVESLLFDKALTQTLVKEGRSRLKTFTMDKCVAETIEVYRKVLQ